MAINAALAQYISAQLVAKKGEAEIRKELLNQGWGAQVIDETYAAVTSGTVPTLSPAGPASVGAKETSTGMTVLTILLLLFVTPIGLIVMWAATNWSKTLKWILTILFILFPLLLLVLAIPVLIAINPAAQFEKANIQATRQDVENIIVASERYYAQNQTRPLNLQELVDANELGSSVIDGSNTYATYEYQQTQGGEDCEVIVTIQKNEPFTVVCSEFDLSKFDELFKAIGSK